MRGQNDEQVERHVHSECDQTDPHRSPRVLPCEIAGGEHFDEAEPNQTPGVGHQTVLGHLHVAITELSVAKDGGRDGPCKHEEANRRRHHDEHHDHREQRSALEAHFLALAGLGQLGGFLGR